MDWATFFQKHSVNLKESPFGLAPVEKPSTEQVLECEKELNFRFPEDYKNFLLEMGPGVLGRCRVYGPTGSMSVLIDPRLQTGRLRNKFQQSEFTKVHSFDLNDLVVFAQETRMNLWFGWKASKAPFHISTSSSPSLSLEYSIYCFDEQPCAPPPRKICDNFEDFVLKVCLGNLLEKLKLKKFSVNTDNDNVNDGDDEDWGDADENLKKEDEAEIHIERFFRPHANGAF